MPARWMEAKLHRMKPRNLRFVDAGTVKESRAVDCRPAELPVNKHADDHIIAAYYARGGKVTRVACKGRMPAKSYGRVCHGSTRGGLNLNPISEKAARERAWDFAPQGLVVWGEQRGSVLIKVTRK